MHSLPQKGAFIQACPARGPHVVHPKFVNFHKRSRKLRSDLVFKAHQLSSV